jgi:hypothetical protein
MSKNKSKPKVVVRPASVPKKRSTGITPSTKTTKKDKS